MPRQRLMKERHVHRLKRHRYPKTGNYIYFCTLPNCHYKIDVPLALGKNSICNTCGDEFIIDESTLKLAKPHCRKCGKVRVANDDGTYSYTKKISNQILTDVALGSANELRARLDSATAVADEDHDI